MPQTSQLYRCPNGACRHIAALEEGGHSQTPGGICCQKCGHINAMDEVSWREMIREAKKGDKRKGTERPRHTRQRRERISRDQDYNGIRDAHLEDNPECAECGRPATRFHHFCNGHNKGASLTNTDLGMGGCDTHGAAWDNKGDYPMPKQFAIKFKAMLKRYWMYTGKRVAIEDVVREMRKA